MPAVPPASAWVVVTASLGFYSLPFHIPPSPATHNFFSFSNLYTTCPGDVNCAPLDLPVGEEWRRRPQPRATVRVFNMDFFRKIVLRHDTGLGEAYMDRVRVPLSVCA